VLVQHPINLQAAHTNGRNMSTCRCRIS